MSKEFIRTVISEHKRVFEEMSDAIWEFAEMKFEEYRSAKIQKDFLEKAGFRISCPAKNMDTAFVAEYGNGKPVIGLLGEFDALAGLSQVSGENVKKPAIEGGAGHGCGHHMLGTGAVEAAFAVKEWLVSEGRYGTIRYYACPAEEGGGGKIHLIRSGALDDCDVALSWHPQQSSFVINGSKAFVDLIYEFNGVSAHAATNPHQGRSALDAAELMNIGANFLREHLPPNTIIQYAFRNAGSPSNNIIPDYASVEYAVRAERKEDLESTLERVHEIAEGAALMAGCTLGKREVVASYFNVKKNDVLTELLKKNERKFADLEYTEEDLGEARRFCTEEKVHAPLYSGEFGTNPMRASTDFGDVSQFIPSAAFCIATYAIGTPLHSWSATAQGKTGYAHKGMHKAARIMAGTAVDMFVDPMIIKRAKAEFDSTAVPYVSQLAERKIPEV